MINGGMSIEFDKVTYASVMKKLEGLTEVEKSKAVQAGLTKGVDYINRYVRRATKKEFKVRKGNLSSSVVRKYVKKRKAAYGAFSRPKGAAAHLLEFGTKKRYTRTGKYRGLIKPSFFKTNIIHERGQVAMKKTADAIEKEIVRILLRA